MSVDWDLVAKLAAPTIAVFVGAALNRAIESRVRLISWLGHASAFTVSGQQGQPPLQVHTHAVVVRNTGRKPARNVRLGHYSLPDFTVWPDIEYTTVDLPGGGKEIVIPNLVPGEQVTISYLYWPPVTFGQINSYTKSDEGMARIFTVLPTPQLPRWVRGVLLALLLVGITTTLYVVFVVMRRLLA